MKRVVRSETVDQGALPAGTVVSREAIEAELKAVSQKDTGFRNLVPRLKVYSEALTAEGPNPIDLVDYLDLFKSKLKEQVHKERIGDVLIILNNFIQVLKAKKMPVSALSPYYDCFNEICQKDLSQENVRQLYADFLWSLLPEINEAESVPLLPEEKALLQECFTNDAVWDPIVFEAVGNQMRRENFSWYQILQYGLKLHSFVVRELGKEPFQELALLRFCLQDVLKDGSEDQKNALITLVFYEARKLGKKVAGQASVDDKDVNTLQSYCNSLMPQDQSLSPKIDNALAQLKTDPMNKDFFIAFIDACRAKEVPSLCSVIEAFVERATGVYPAGRAQGHDVKPVNLGRPSEVEILATLPGQEVAAQVAVCDLLLACVADSSNADFIEQLKKIYTKPPFFSDDMKSAFAALDDTSINQASKNSFLFKFIVAAGNRAPRLECENKFILGLFEQARTNTLPSELNYLKIKIVSEAEKIVTPVEQVVDDVADKEVVAPPISTVDPSTLPAGVNPVAASEVDLPPRPAQKGSSRRPTVGHEALVTGLRGGSVGSSQEAGAPPVPPRPYSPPKAAQSKDTVFGGSGEARVAEISKVRSRSPSPE